MSQLNKLVWLDLEMTGLIPEKNRIIEIATVITDTNLEVLAVGPNIAIHQSESALAEMDEWNQTHHGQSGLIERVRQSLHSEQDAEEETLKFLSQHIQPGQSPLCGNSIWQDRRFLYNYMPKLANFFHYRNIDVSTLKVLANYWSPHMMQKVEKSTKHLALEDVYESIEELRYYRKHFIKTE